MITIRVATLLSLLMVLTCQAAQIEFPKAPLNLKEAESQGLHRMSGEELKPLFPGTMDVRQYNGEERRTVTKADGSLETKFVANQVTATGKWRIDEQNNTYCTGINWKKGYREDCHAIFRAPDGIHYFTYDLKTGFAGGVWRRAADQ
jgi:hypothetical protein